MPEGYVIAQLKVTNPENYKEYIEKVTDVIKKYGGEYLVRGGKNVTVEGSWQHPRTVVIKFPSYDKAMEWYNSEDYKPIKQIRLDNADSNGMIIEGI